MSHPVPARHAADRLANLQGLFDQANLLVETPSPPTLGAQHLDLHSPRDLKARLKVKSSGRLSNYTRRPTPEGYLFFDVARVLEAKRPRHILLENVKGLLSHDDGRTFKVIIATLVELGYCVEWQVLNSKDFGVPQNRERVFIVGHLGGEPAPQVFPLESNGGADLSGVSIIDGYNRRPTKEIGTVRQNMGNGGSLIGGSHIRRLTPLECERLQGFPDGWTGGVSNTQRYKCLGNAVTVNVIEAVIRRLYS